MSHLVRRSLVALLLAGLVPGGAAVAQQRKAADPPRRVQDDAGLFSEAAVRKANERIAEIKRRYHKDLLIETVERVTRDGKTVTFKDNAEKHRFFVDLAARKVENARVNGVYVLISEDPKYVQVVEGQVTRERGLFTEKDRDELAKKVIAGLNSGNKDRALENATAFVGRTFEEHKDRAGAVAAAGRSGDRAPAGADRESGLPWWVGWVCIGVVVLAVIWVVFALIRAFSGGGAAAGPGGAPAYGYGGGGGGGFFPSLLGGLFGAAAGMWMYNHFFGGGTPAAYGGGAADPGAQGMGGADQTDVGGDYAGGGGGGGDWGTDQAAGGGGTEWQDPGAGDFGGGDLGGGGDWGGGGGDFGGGGGDFGGGGGDW
jgi:uncharacterized protein